MTKQYNKVEKRRRRCRYIKRTQDMASSYYEHIDELTSTVTNPDPEFVSVEVKEVVVAVAMVNRALGLIPNRFHIVVPLVWGRAQPVEYCVGVVPPCHEFSVASHSRMRVFPPGVYFQEQPFVPAV